MLLSFSFHVVDLPIINPIVTSSGKRILSPMLMNLPSPAMGNIRRVSALLKQNPAPPVANQNVIFFEGVSVGIFCIKQLLLGIPSGKHNFLRTLTLSKRISRGLAMLGLPRYQSCDGLYSSKSLTKRGMLT